MAIFAYTAISGEGGEQKGTVDAANLDFAISALQRRGLVISKIEPVEEKKVGLSTRIAFFDRITNEDIVMLSRQITTLFQAQVSALRSFRLLAAEARTPRLAQKLTEIANDIQSGNSISTALSQQPEVFSTFYVNMVRSGEETGKLDETFAFLADYLDRNYTIMQKARNAMIYPAFIIVTFAGVMTLMMTLVVPRLADMLTNSGQSIPVFTQIIISISLFFRNYILLLLIIIVVAAIFFYQYGKTSGGKIALSRARLEIPAVGSIYQKIFLSRIADTLATMLRSGVQILRALEVTGAVVGDPTYQAVLTEAATDVKGGMPLSDALRKHDRVPGIVVAMTKIGEETGNMGPILETIAKFYRREVDSAVDTLVDLIEPFMIVTLAVGVAILLAAVLLPIYNIASSF